MKKAHQVLAKITFIAIGLISLIWFLIRVIPKPSRASYPCQRAAFPIASTFVIWLSGTVFSFISFKNARRLFSSQRTIRGLVFLSIGVVFFFATYLAPNYLTLANNLRATFHTGPALEMNYNTDAQAILPEAVVSIVRSEEEQALDIDVNQVESMVREAVNLAGGLKDIISDGDVVVLKPNIVGYTFKGADIPKTANGMVTDWRILAATAKIVRELNPTGKILVMEGTVEESTLTGYERLNMTKDYIPEVDEFIAFEDVSGTWHNYDAPELVAAKFSNGEGLYDNNEKPNNSDEYYFNKTYYDADVLISLPVLKNHESAGVTGSIKNLAIGTTPTNIYGRSDGNNLRWQVINHNYPSLHKFIHDYYFLRQADFAIMDGLQGYSNGPWDLHGSNTIEGHQENMRVVMASRDLVALDAIESIVMGDDPRKVDYLVYLNNSKAGSANVNAIRVAGTSPFEIKKPFPHESNITQCTYTDFTAPANVSISSIQTDNGQLTLQLENTSEIHSLEIEIDNTLLPHIYVNDFSEIVLDISNIAITDSVITIKAHDEYLNTTTIEHNISSFNTTAYNLTFSATDKLHIYPHCVKSFLNISLENSLEGEVFIDVYSADCKHIKSEKAWKTAAPFLKQVDMTDLQSGNYILKVIVNGQAETRKFIKL